MRLFLIAELQKGHVVAALGEWEMQLLKVGNKVFKVGNAVIQYFIAL